MWSLTGPDVPPDEPVLVVDDRVTAATQGVLDSGVTLGMPRREAEALAPFATVLIRDLGEEIRCFEPVVATVEGLVPRVEVVAPGLMYLPVAGAVRFYGSEEILVGRVIDVLDVFPSGDAGTAAARGWQALVGVADGPFAARWAAATASPGEPRIIDDTLGFLSGLDLETLREAMGGAEMIETFRWLGISTLGDLASLPRDTLASRFGNPGLIAHRLASGDDRMLDPRAIPEELGVEMGFEEPLQSLEEVSFAGRHLSERLLKRLRVAGVAPHTVTIIARAGAGPERTRVWRSADPFDEKSLTERVWWQLRAWVETAGIPGGVSFISITPSDLSGAGRQLGLFTDESSILEAERALARTQALLGPDGVLQARPQGGRMPGERVVWSRWGEPETDVELDPTAPWPGATPGPAPALVPPRRDPVEVEWEGGMPSRIRLGTRWEPVLTWSGPWRLSGRWWAGEEDADRYQLVTSVGAFLCVIQAGRAYLAGVYD